MLNVAQTVSTDSGNFTDMLDIIWQLHVTSTFSISNYIQPTTSSTTTLSVVHNIYIIVKLFRPLLIEREAISLNI